MKLDELPGNYATVVSQDGRARENPFYLQYGQGAFAFSTPGGNRARLAVTPELHEFLRNPADSKYGTAAREAESLRREQEKQQREGCSCIGKYECVYCSGNMIGADADRTLLRVHVPRLGRALGRVLAHELYHIFANTTKHARAGIAKSCYTAPELLADEFHLTERRSSFARP